MYVYTIQPIQLKSYVASKSCLKLAARAVLSADAGLYVRTVVQQAVDKISIHIVRRILCYSWASCCMRTAVTGQLADTPTRGLPTRGLDISRTGQLAVSQMPPKRET